MSGLNSESEPGSEPESESGSRAVETNSFLPLTAAGAESQVGTESQLEYGASAGAWLDVVCVHNGKRSPPVLSPTPPELFLGPPVHRQLQASLPQVGRNMFGARNLNYVPTSRRAVISIRPKIGRSLFRIAVSERCAVRGPSDEQNYTTETALRR